MRNIKKLQYFYALFNDAVINRNIVFGTVISLRDGESMNISSISLKVRDLALLQCVYKATVFQTASYSIGTGSAFLGSMAVNARNRPSLVSIPRLRMSRDIISLTYLSSRSAQG
jgi:hypothetical protein